MSLEEIIISDDDETFIENIKTGLKIKHDNHYGYVYDGKLNCYDDETCSFLSHNLSHNVEDCKKVKTKHDHNNLVMIPHFDHYDYIIGNRLHYMHGNHCDDHGEIELMDDIDMINNKKISKYWQFILMIFLVGSFFFVEIITGIIIESLALQADAIHMLADLFALIVAFYSVILIQRNTTDRATFGWIRAEIIGALINGVFLISSCLFITMEAIHRFRNFKELETTLGKEIDKLLIVGGIGLAINFIGIGLFLFGNNHSHGGHSHNHNHSNNNNLNIRALLLHMMGDILGSIGVIISGIIIKYVKSEYRFLADPLVSLVIVSLILFNAIPLVKQCIHILLQKVPKYIDVNKIRIKIMKINGVVNVHHLHIWQLNDARIIGTLHVSIKKNINSNINKKIQKILHRNGVHCTTIQLEIYNKNNINCKNIKCDEKICQTDICCGD